MARQNQQLTKLLDGIKAALAERDEVVELSRSIAGRLEAAEVHLRDAHAELDVFLAGGPVSTPSIEAVVALGDGDAAAPAVESESETDALRRKVKAGLVDEAPCQSGHPHDPHQWDDELGAVICPGVAADSEAA